MLRSEAPVLEIEYNDVVLCLIRQANPSIAWPRMRMRRTADLELLLRVNHHQELEDLLTKVREVYKNDLVLDITEHMFCDNLLRSDNHLELVKILAPLVVDETSKWLTLYVPEDPYRCNLWLFAVHRYVMVEHRKDAPERKDALLTALVSLLPMQSMFGVRLRRVALSVALAVSVRK